ncbi:hypothetical protein D3C71_1824870 [compost metagenome]
MPPGHDVVQHGQVAKKPQILKRASHAKRTDRMARNTHDAFASEVDRAFIRDDHARQHVDHRALAGTVRPDERVDVAVL